MVPAHCERPKTDPAQLQTPPPPLADKPSPQGPCNATARNQAPPRGPHHPPSSVAARRPPVAVDDTDGGADDNDDDDDAADDEDAGDACGARTLPLHRPSSPNQPSPVFHCRHHSAHGQNCRIAHPQPPAPPATTQQRRLRSSQENAINSNDPKTTQKRCVAKSQKIKTKNKRP